MKRSRLVLFAARLFSMAAPPPSPAGGSPRRQAAAPSRDSVADGHLTFNGTRCREYLPGLFFTYDGEALDFRGTVATFRNIALIRTRR